MENNLVKVLLWGKEVGVMYWDASANRAIFEYSPDFLRTGVDVAPLTCSIQYYDTNPYIPRHRSTAME